MATSRELIGRLLARGLSRRQIGQLVGRNDSLIGQIERGAKPGRNLEAALQAIVDGQPPPPPPRRSTRKGQPAHVRAPHAALEGRTWETRGVGTSAARAGARSFLALLRAAAAPRTSWLVAFEIEFRKARIIRDSGDRRKRPRGPLAKGVRGSAHDTVVYGQRGTLTARWFLDYCVRHHGGNVTMAVLTLCRRDGLIDRVRLSDVFGLEIRVWAP